MSNSGHNENAVRLAALVGDAKIALDKVARGEADALDGWLAYGAALNEGRALHTSENGTEDDRGFGGWIKDNDLSQLATDEVSRDDRAAAMWGAANADQLAEARASCNARTLRGLHKQWKSIEADREKAALDAEKAKLRKDAEARAKAADEEAAKRKAEEEKARKDAAEATDEAVATAALARAAEAAKAADAAEAAATVAKQDATPVEEPDPHAAARKGLSNLTREGLEDEVIGLREENTEVREKLKKANGSIKSLRSDIADLKEQLSEFSANDPDGKINKLQSKAFRLRDERDETKVRLAKETRRANFFEEKAKSLEKQNLELRENQVVSL